MRRIKTTTVRRDTAARQPQPRRLCATWETMLHGTVERLRMGGRSPQQPGEPRVAASTVFTWTAEDRLRHAIGSALLKATRRFGDDDSEEAVDPGRRATVKQIRHDASRSD